MYSRFDGTGGQINGAFGGAGSGGTGSIDAGGASSGGAGGRGLGSGVGSGGVGASGGAPGSGGSHQGTGGAGVGGSGSVLLGTGGSPVGTGGAGGAGAGVGGSDGVLLGSGGSPVGTGGAGTGGHAGTSGAPGTGGTGPGGSGAGGATVAGDPSHYGFESSLQAWGTPVDGGSWTSIERSTAVTFAGASSLAGSVSAQPGVVYILEVASPTPAIPAGSIVTFHVQVPTAAVLTSIQPYVMETGTYRFTGTLVAGADLARNAWVKVDVKVPTDAASILRIGVQFASNGTWSGTVYLDAIDW